ncbi:glycosyltransferase family 2 protein [Protaetiibacter intestinalis]|uniref:Glycosyltransferase family 2 protein n=1 Tax=Protaetiibacter intestinalis TaxID=2419774 RepID=A0A387B439_9MICO|nr:glycosyltransferase family 2 protein [Protaetiibacter intestinalis]AYF98352.1 glycosyltransferase family 2 protein [Protaetiibacter intestinalis]
MGNETPRVLVVIPAYNEAETLPAVIRELQRVAPEVDCLVVDDGSRDGTAAVAQASGARTASLPFNLGVGGAMRTGYRYGAAHGYDVVVQLDADGQHDPAAIATLVGALDDADLVIGARFAGVGDYRVRGPRKWAMGILSAVLSRVTGHRLTDSTSGFKAAGDRAIRLFAEHYPAEYLGDTVEALVIAARSDCRVTQVPVAMRPRAGGSPSHGPFKSTVFLGRAMIALVFALIHPRSTYAEAARP